MTLDRAAFLDKWTRAESELEALAQRCAQVLSVVALHLKGWTDPEQKRRADNICYELEETNVVLRDIADEIHLLLDDDRAASGPVAEEDL